MKKGIAALLAVSGAVFVISSIATPVYAVTPLTMPDRLLTHGSSTSAQRQRDVRVVDNGITRLYHTFAANVADFLEESGYVLEIGDTINMAMDERFIDNYIPRIVITRGVTVNVKIDGEEQSLRIPADSRIGHVIALVELEYGEVYFHNLRRSAPVEPGQTFEFYRPTSHTFTSNMPIPYEVQHNYDPTINIGEEVVVQEGEPGVTEIVSEIIMLAGIRIDSRLLSEAVMAEPIDRVIAVGTRNPAPRPRFEIPSAEGNFAFSRQLTMTATAYTAGFESTGKRPGDPGYGITASGMRVQHGVVAVDPSVIPLGTPLFIEGYGFAVAADTGSAIRGYKIDLFMYNVQDALNFGRRTVNVFILE
ncbi:MAG: 3D domain-containing protein [Defluviitaleaceae bacterium]|nr:3D domain-containing protein [Defluviitaleaceae bacterium]